MPEQKRKLMKQPEVFLNEVKNKLQHTLAYSVGDLGLIIIKLERYNVQLSQRKEDEFRNIVKEAFNKLFEEIKLFEEQLSPTSIKKG